MLSVIQVQKATLALLGQQVLLVAQVAPLVCKAQPDHPEVPKGLPGLPDKQAYQVKPVFKVTPVLARKALPALALPVLRDLLA